MTKKIKWFVFSVLFACGGICACSSDDDGETPAPPAPATNDLELNSGFFPVNYVGGVRIIQLRSNKDWEVAFENEAIKSWITVTPDQGKGSDNIVEVQIKVNKNLEQQRLRETSLLFKQVDANETAENLASEKFDISQSSGWWLMQDSLVLLKIRAKLHPENWRRPWDLSKPLSQWPGVFIDEWDGVERVGSLWFSNINSVGQKLGDNNIEGEIPEEIAELTSLKGLAFQNEPKLTGSLPVLPKNMTTLNITNCGIGGVLPKAMCEHDSLTLVTLSNNQFTSFEEGFSSARKSIITTLLLDGNQFSGPLDPEHFLYLTHLKVLTLNNNNFEGTLSPMLIAGKELMQLGLSGNRFSGDFPKQIKNNYVFELTGWESICPQQASYSFTAGTCH